MLELQNLLYSGLYYSYRCSSYNIELHSVLYYSYRDLKVRSNEATVEHDVRCHKSEEQSQTTGAALAPRETAARRATDDGKPKVTISEVLSRFGPKKMTKCRQVSFSSHFEQTISLKNMFYSQSIEITTTRQSQS